MLNTTKKRRIGSGEVAAEDLPSIENAFNNILDTIHAISTGKLEDVEDLHNIKIGVIQALDTVVNIKKWIKENPDSDVKVCVICIVSREPELQWPLLFFDNLSVIILDRLSHFPNSTTTYWSTGLVLE